MKRFSVQIADIPRPALCHRNQLLLTVPRIDRDELSQLTLWENEKKNTSLKIALTDFLGSESPYVFFERSLKLLEHRAYSAAHPLSLIHQHLAADWIPRPAQAIFGKVLKPSPSLSKVILSSASYYVS